MIARTVATSEVQGIPTPMKMEFDNEHERRRVTLTVTSVDYEAAIPEEYFSTLALVRASVALGQAARSGPGRELASPADAP